MVLDALGVAGLADAAAGAGVTLAPSAETLGGCCGGLAFAAAGVFVAVLGGTVAAAFCAQGGRSSGARFQVRVRPIILMTR